MNIHGSGSTYNNIVLKNLVRNLIHNKEITIRASSFNGVKSEIARQVGGVIRKTGSSVRKGDSMRMARIIWIPKENNIQNERTKNKINNNTSNTERMARD